MKVFIAASIFCFFTLTTTAQFTSTQSGDWGTGATWGGTGPAYTGLGNVNITINHKVVVGSNGATQDMTFATNKEAQSFTINNRLTIYGNVTFANKAMNLVIADGATVLIFGNLTLNNKINLNSGGTLVVTGTFDKAGSQGSFLGDGKVYAGSYSGDAEDFTPGDAENNADQQQSLADLETDNTDGSLDEVINAIETGTPLPITLKYFKLAQSTQGILLDWATLSEENFDYFEIQRAGNNGVFEVIKTIKGNGNSTDVKKYSWIDESPLFGINYYRLESVDFDGYRETFPMEAIKNSEKSAKFSIYPNHIDKNGVLSISGVSLTDAEILFIDNTGKVKYQTNAVSEKITLPYNIESGVYMILYKQGQNVQTHRLIVN